MTKEEKIKEAWGKLMPDYTNIDLDNGWSLNDFYEEDFNDNDFNDNDFHTMQIYTPCKIRPKSLQGIENNNGWTRIESEDDLPNDDILYHVLINGIAEVFENYEISLSYYNKRGITHYRPIEIPKSPLY